MAEKDSYLNLAKAIYEGVGKLDIPEIEGMKDFSEVKFKQFNYVLSGKVGIDEGVSFFLDDYQFERVWNRPELYCEMLKKYKCVLSPDFSLFTDFPKAVQMFNHYRKHWVAKYWQDNGIKVIPTIAWSDEDSFEWCFDGEPKNSVVAVSTLGVWKNPETKKAFLLGYEKMKEVLNPSKILIFCHTPIKELEADNVLFVQYDFNIGGVTREFKNKEGK